jgi:glycosyltransferase 2 family protein
VQSDTAQLNSAQSDSAQSDSAQPVGRSPLARVRAALGGKALRFGFVLVAVALGGYAVADQWSQVRAGFAELGVGIVAAALGLVLLALLVTMQVWRSLLTSSGSRVPFAPAARIFFVGQIGKYLPGAVWPVLAQMELGQAQRIPRRRSATVAVLTMLVSLAAGLLTAACATAPILAGSVTAGYRWAFLAVPVLLVGLHPRVLNPLIDRLLRMAKRPPLDVPLTGRAIVAATGWAVLGWLLNGLHIYLMAARLGAPSARTLLLAIGGFAFAWCVGFLVVFAPAGAGVREVVLVASLTPVLSVGKATAVALASRLLTTVGDLLCAGLAAWFGRGRAAAPATAD